MAWWSRIRPRFAWWIVLTIGVVVAVAMRWHTIWTEGGVLSDLDRGLLVLGVLLLLLPVVSQFEGFGFKVRAPLDPLKPFIPREATAGEVKKVEGHLLREIGQRLQETSMGLQALLASIPKQEQDLAVVRHEVEREVWRVWKARRTVQPPLPTGTPLGPQTAEQAAQDLMNQDKLPKDLGRAAQMVLWFAGPQPPGDLPDLPRADQVRFVIDAGWTVVKRLKNQT